MGLFGFLKGKKKIEGSIGYLGLADWWISEFSEAEQDYIIQKYQPMGSSGSSLIEGKILSTSQTPIHLLWGLAGWFSKPEDRQIAYRIIKKAEDLIDSSTNALDMHFLYNVKLEISYKDRDSKPDGLERAIEACEQQIAHAPKAAEAFRRQYGKELPGHKGFQQLAIVKEKQEDFKGAVSLCKTAISQGWAGDWEKRIKRCNKKIEKT